MNLNKNENIIKNIIEDELRVSISSSARTRLNSIAKKLFVYMCVNLEDTPYKVIASNIDRTESLVKVYMWKYKDISFDNKLNIKYNKLTKIYERIRL